MSSFIGHVLIGSSIAAGNRQPDSVRAMVLLSLCTWLAVSPDIDYLMFWIFDYRIVPRYTHSIGFCVFVGVFAWCLKYVFRRRLGKGVPSWPLFAAPLSHIAMDLLVGVHPMPLFWPVYSALVVLPFGVLPSAAAMNISNIFFWRNLLLEIGMLVPVSIMIVAEYRVILLKRHRLPALIVLCVFVVSAVIGANLKR